MIIRKMNRLLLVSLVFLYAFLDATYEVSATTEGGGKMTISITSTAFTDGEMIPRDYTCDGRNISPPLAFADVPEGAKSLAIIVDDPDAPMGTWVHWVLYNIPNTVSGVPAGIASDRVLPNGAHHGINSFSKFGYGGPCPPSGTHRYYFKLYALDTELMQEPGLSKDELLKAMQGHVLAEGQLMGRYKR